MSQTNKNFYNFSKIVQGTNIYLFNKITVGTINVTLSLI